MILALILIAMSVVFWTLFEQAGSSMSFFAEDHTQLEIPGVLAITAEQTQSFNAGFILLFAPDLRVALGVPWPQEHGLQPGAEVRAGADTGRRSLLLPDLWAGSSSMTDLRMPLIFLVLAYMMQTTGELFLSPVGLSVMTKLSPASDRVDHDGGLVPVVVVGAVSRQASSPARPRSSRWADRCSTAQPR